MVPDGVVSSSGQEAAELAESAGLVLDPWQRLSLEVALGERADGSWAAFEVGEVVARQNGKGAVVEARELAGLFLFGEQLLLHTAHEFKTAAEAFRRVLFLVENADFLRKKVRRVRTSHGEEGIELRSGARLRFVARSTGSGRGFTGDVVILDEAYNLGPEQMAALLPTLSARPNPQVWYTSSAPMSTSAQLHAVRKRALKGGDGRLAYLEWSMPKGGDPDDRANWALANPSLGIRISEEFIAAERAALPLEVFLRERLSVPDDPPDEGEAVVTGDEWRRCLDGASRVAGSFELAVDVSPDRRVAAIGAAGYRADRVPHVEVIAVDQGTRWVAEWFAARRGRYAEVTVDPGSAAGALIPDLRDAGVEVREITTRQHAQACGAFLIRAKADPPMLRHPGQQHLADALVGAKLRQLADGVAWDRRGSGIVIAPLVAVTLALGALLDKVDDGDPAANVW